VLFILLAFITVESHAQGLPPWKEFVTADDAKSRPIKPTSKAGLGRAPAYQLGASFEADMRAAADIVRRGARFPDDAYSQQLMSAECERIVNTVYRLTMLAHANSLQAATSRGKKGSIDYNTPMGAVHGAQNDFATIILHAKRYRDELASAARIARPPLREQMSAEDFRNMLSDDGLREYQRQGLLPAALALDTVLALPAPGAHKDLDRGGINGLSSCNSDCIGRKWGRCEGCARSGMENAEGWYHYLAAEWETYDRWYHFWRRVELTDHFVGMLGAGYPPPPKPLKP
jgi:hypothetical protein